MKRFVALGIIVGTAIGGNSLTRHESVNNAFLAFHQTCIAPRKQETRGPEVLYAQYGFIDNKGRTVIPLRYEAVREFREGLCAFKQGSNWGYMDITGKTIIEPQFSEAYDFVNGIAGVRKGLYVGYIDKSGKLIIQARFADGEDFSKFGNVRVTFGSQQFLLNAKGEDIIDTTLSSIDMMKNGLFDARENDKHGLMQPDGKWLVKPKYQALLEGDNGMIAFQENSKWGFLDMRGRVVIQPKYLQCGAFRDGVAPVKRADGRCALITPKEEFTYVFPPDCGTVLTIPQENLKDNREIYENNLVPVWEKGHWGFVSADTGKFVIEPKYADVGLFENGLARVGIRGYGDDSSDKASEEMSDETSDDNSDEATNETSDQGTDESNDKSSSASSDSESD